FLLFTQSSLYATKGQIDLPIRAHAQEPGVPLLPGQALDRLRGLQPVPKVHTRLSEAPFWFVVSLPAGLSSATDRVVEFASRHTTSLECWNGDTLQQLGQADQETAEGALRRVKAGH